MVSDHRMMNNLAQQTWNYSSSRIHTCSQFGSQTLKRSLKDYIIWEKGLSPDPPPLSCLPRDQLDIARVKSKKSHLAISLVQVTRLVNFSFKNSLLASSSGQLFNVSSFGVLVLVPSHSHLILNSTMATGLVVEKASILLTRHSISTLLICAPSWWTLKLEMRR